MQDVAKICKNCGPLKAEFVRFRIRNNKTVTDCKICDKAQGIKWRKKNPEKLKEYNRKNRSQSIDPSIKELHCGKCKLTKPVDQFNPYMLRIKYPYCRECRILATANHHAKAESKKKHRDWYNRKYKDISEDKRMKKQYGISLEDYKKMSELQKGLCLICKKPELTFLNQTARKLSIDHCHKTGKVRGLLCQKCNMAIGIFSESEDILNSAIKYLSNN
jgi:hypothetical protein